LNRDIATYFLLGRPYGAQPFNVSELNRGEIVLHFDDKELVEPLLVLEHLSYLTLGDNLS
jgi:hypothetical protein